MAWPWPFKSLWAASEATRPGIVLPVLGVFPQGFSHQPLGWPPRWCLSASPKILLRLIHKGKPGGPGAGARGTSPERELSQGGRWGVQAGGKGLEAGTQQGLPTSAGWGNSPSWS